MTNTAIENFRSLAPLLLPELIDLNRLEAIDDYDDYALMTFTLAEPMSLENVIDSLEDQMEVTILYHMVTSDAKDAGQHCCAYSNPSFEHMYKINTQTETDGMAHTLYVYDSLEVMMESLKEDMQHSETGYFKSNPLKSIPSKEKYQPTESEREYLTMDEVKILMNTDCPHAEVKRAFLLSVFTGLRLSDIRTLTWAKILNAPDGVTKLIRTKMQKTQKFINLPLSAEAMSCLNKKDDPNELIYTLPAGTSNIERNIKKWLEAAGIEKHITFHCARHTFATMMLTLGADLFTTSKLMGHTNVQTTAIYAKIVDQKKVETVNLVDSFFGK